MNQLMLLVVALVAFTWFGGKYVPKVLKDNKQILLGVVVGLVLYSFMGLRLEGFKLEGAGDNVDIWRNNCCENGTWLKTNEGCKLPGPGGEAEGYLDTSVIPAEGGQLDFPHGATLSDWYANAYNSSEETIDGRAPHFYGDEHIQVYYGRKRQLARDICIGQSKEEIVSEEEVVVPTQESVHQTYQ